MDNELARHRHLPHFIHTKKLKGQAATCVRSREFAGAVMQIGHVERAAYE